MHQTIIYRQNYPAQIKDPGRTFRLDGRSRGQYYLQAIKPLYEADPETTELVWDLAYEIIASQINSNPEMASELRAFNATDVVLFRDILKYKQQRKNR